jgi:dephospho-CoA kinase
MLNVGLTGGIACGKSTVAQMLVGHGAYLIDFDVLAHEVEEPERPAWKEITERFGPEILAANKEIDRNKLAGLVFADKEKLKALNNIVHPYILQEWQARLAAIKKTDTHAIVLSDVPLLFEEKLQHLFDLALLVLISPEEQICRLMARNGLTQDESQKRLQSQMPIADKIKLADIVIDNKGTVPATEKIVAQVWKELLTREETKRKNQ